MVQKKKDVFDFDKKMKEFMNKSNDNNVFKPLLNTVNNISNLKNIGENIKDELQNNIKDELQNNIKDELKNINLTISDNNNDIENNKNDIENNKNDIENNNQPIKPIDDTNR